MEVNLTNQHLIAKGSHLQYHKAYLKCTIRWIFFLLDLTAF